NRAYTVADYQKDIADLSITGMVFIECDVAPHYTLLEAQHIAKIACTEPRLQGIVASAPVDYGTGLHVYLDALVALGPQITGVRRLLQGEAYPRAVCLHPDFVRGVQLLSTYGLSFDLCVRHWQLPAVTELARLCPDTQFILDHLGKPDIKAGRL